MAQSLVDGVWQFGEGRGYVHRNIKFGITHMGMPAYGDSLADAQIGKIVDFLLAAESAAAPKPLPIPKELQTLDYGLNVEIIAEGLEVPWSIDFLDKEHALVTERPGRIRQLLKGRLLPEPVRGTPDVLNEGQGGLLDVAVDPQYAENGWIYLAYSHALETQAGKSRPPAMTRIVRGRLKDNTWTDRQVIYEAPHETYRTTRHHYGCRIVFDRKGHLFFGIGDRGAMDQAQQLNRPNGKIHRIFRDGRIPPDNPYVNSSDALPSIFAYGIRNPQGLAVHPVTDELWETEHGPLGGDEINCIRSGRNYGWPVICYCRNYDGSIITELVEKPGMEQPIYYWRPSIAVCGSDFVRGNLLPKWRNHLLVTALKYEEVRLLDIKDNRVMHDEVILKNAGRVRDVACGPDGAIFVVLNSPGAILRLTPKETPGVPTASSTDLFTHTSTIHASSLTGDQKLIISRHQR
jgi:glucose/arabinose dehydrogenase